MIILFITNIYRIHVVHFGTSKPNNISANSPLTYPTTLPKIEKVK
jgi:hypothetical protein